MWSSAAHLDNNKEITSLLHSSERGGVNSNCLKWIRFKWIQLLDWFAPPVDFNWTIFLRLFISIRPSNKPLQAGSRDRWAVITWPLSPANFQRQLGSCKGRFSHPLLWLYRTRCMCVSVCECVCECVCVSGRWEGLIGSRGWGERRCKSTWKWLRTSRGKNEPTLWRNINCERNQL